MRHSGSFKSSLGARRAYPYWLPRGSRWCRRPSSTLRTDKRTAFCRPSACSAECLCQNHGSYPDAPHSAVGSRSLPAKQINAHGCRRTLRMRRLLLELENPAVLIRIHHAEPLRFVQAHLDDGDGAIGILLLVVSQHTVIIHLIDVISDKIKTCSGSY